MPEPIEPIVEPIVDPIVDPIANPEPSPAIDPERYAAANRDLMKFKSQSREKDGEIERLRGELKERETAKLEGKEEYKKLYESAKEELAREKKDKDDLYTSVFHNQKMKEIESACRKAGMDEDAVKDLERYPEYTDLVAVETTSGGRIQVDGVDTLVEKLKAERIKWFSKGKSANFNPHNPDGHIVKPKTLSGPELNELEKKDPAAYYKYMKDVRGVG